MGMSFDFVVEGTKKIDITEWKLPFVHYEDE